MRQIVCRTLYLKIGMLFAFGRYILGPLVQSDTSIAKFDIFLHSSVISLIHIDLNDSCRTTFGVDYRCNRVSIKLLQLFVMKYHQKPL